MPSKVFMDTTKPTMDLNEFTLFQILERLRIRSLRELYHGGGSRRYSHSKTDNQADHVQEAPELPKYPSRYQCLDLSPQWLVTETNKRRRDLSVHDTSIKDQFRTLDQPTKMFLEDVVSILRNHSGNTTANRRPTPPCIPSLAPTPITPPASPLTLPLVASEDSELTTEVSHVEDARRIEVDMTDEEILSLWRRMD